MDGSLGAYRRRRFIALTGPATFGSAARVGVRRLLVCDECLVGVEILSTQISNRVPTRDLQRPRRCELDELSRCFSGGAAGYGYSNVEVLGAEGAA